MHLKWFKGREVPEVMRQVREELGPDAVILHSKTARPWGPLRFVRSGGVEVLAAVDRADSPRIAGTPPAHPAASPPTEALEAQVAELRALFVKLAGGRLLPPALEPFYDRLVSGGMEPPLALRLLADLPPSPADGANDDRGAGARAVEEHLATRIRVAGPGARPGTARLALVGPAGAGKTTTLAKLAAHAQIAGGRIAILNADGSGLGGPSPLETFAAILDVPHLMAFTPDEVAEQLQRSAVRENVLIDTPGLGPDDQSGLSRLGELLHAARPAEVHLVLSATSKTADALAAVRAFSSVGITHLLFTHLDETASCASVLGTSVESGLPLSYFGTGREIPGDLDFADARDVVRRTLQRERSS
jgi:flagellar biosynthesis protein FlhF